MALLEIASVLPNRRNNIYCKCETCEATTPVFKARQFKEMVERMKTENWFMKPKYEGSSMWLHFCPSCVEAAYENEDRTQLKIMRNKPIKHDVEAFKRYREKHRPHI